MSLAATAQEEWLNRSIPNYNVYNGTGVPTHTPEVCRPEILSLLYLNRAPFGSTSLNTKFDNLVVICRIGSAHKIDHPAVTHFVSRNGGNDVIQSSHFHYAEKWPSAVLQNLAQVSREESPQDVTAPRAVSRTEMLAAIQNAFALNVTQLAEILNVTRVTVYQWRKEDAAPLKEESRARLQQIYGLATFWRSLAAVPGAQLHEYIAGMNTTLEATLKQSDVDRDQLGKIHAALLRAESSQVRRQRAVQAQREALAKLKANLVDTPVPGVIAD